MILKKKKGKSSIKMCSAVMASKQSAPTRVVTSDNTSADVIETEKTENSKINFIYAS